MSFEQHTEHDIYFIVYCFQAKLPRKNRRKTDLSKEASPRDDEEPFIVDGRRIFSLFNFWSSYSTVNK